jgi:sensor c-di-GMP phosphodiesterase-like protein
MFAVDDGNRSTYYQRTRQQARPTNIIPALNGHGDQQNVATARGVENIAPTPSTPTVASVAARQQQLQQQLQQQQQAALAAAQGALLVTCSRGSAAYFVG